MVEIINLKKKPPQNLDKKQERKDTLKNLCPFFEDRERVLNAFDSKKFQIKIENTGFSDNVLDHSNLKILTPKQMLQRLPIALALVKACNTSENLLNKIKQIISSLYRAKEITKNVYNNMMNSIRL